MAVLSAGHLLTDVSQGAVPALLPFLITRHHLGYASASALVLAATISSSVIQPLFGHISDRRSLPWLMPLGPLVGALGIGLAGVAPSYGPLFAAIVLSGIGVAAFHPEGSRFANYVSGARRASGMSLFSVGGNAGFALGPALVTPLVLAFGLSGTLFLLIPGCAMAALLAREIPHLVTFRPVLAAGHPDAPAQRAEWGAFTLLGAVIALRSFVYFGLVTFIPLYFLHDLHASKAVASAALTTMLAGGAVGTLIGGPLADRFGRRAVLLASFASLPPIVAAFLAAGTIPAILMVCVSCCVSL
jgi:FSR family fosmidomycin resistance protein-like MFS transporter